MAAENIMLEAVEQGLGSCPVLMFDESALKPVLNIPDTHDIALVIVMGYPDESPLAEAAAGPLTVTVDAKGVRHVPKRKLAEIAHKNKF
jgi:nitroreductase